MQFSSCSSLSWSLAINSAEFISPNEPSCPWSLEYISQVYRDQRVLQSLQWSQEEHKSLFQLRDRAHGLVLLVGVAEPV